jgi:signal transduction histidine kinase
MAVMVQRNEQRPTALLKSIQVSPRCFKRQLETVLQALGQLRLRVTLLAKLPKGNSWLVPLEQYGQAIAAPPPGIFLFDRDQRSPLNWAHWVNIPSAHPMRGEYFLLAVSESVGLMIVGQREDLPTALTSDDSDAIREEEPDSLPKVRYRFTLQRALVQQKLDDLETVMQSSLAELPGQAALRHLLATWGDRLRPPSYTYPALMDAILLLEGQDQDALQQRTRALRRQAMVATSLSTQNEALINTLRLKDDFLNTVGQELRTPLSTIKTALPLLASPSLKPPQRQRYLDMIGRECDRQVNLINGLLELLQIERSLPNTKLDPVKVFDVLPGVVSTYQPLAQEKGVRLAYTVPNSLPAVCCPENWLRQIVIHLLSNSIRYTEAGGEVWVTAQTEDDDTLTIEVKDTGMGIAPHDLPHIFNHFYRGRQAGQDEEGVGLGLSIVQQLLLYCGGQIHVESQPEVGTHFKVRLPQYHP